MASDVAKAGSLLSRCRVAELVGKKGELVDVEETTSIHEVLQILNRHGILSVPVWRTPAADEVPSTLQLVDGKVYTGVVSVLDCVSYALNAGAKAEAARASPWSAMTYAVPTVLQDPVSKALGSTAESSTLAVFEAADDSTLLTAMDAFTRVHRALVPRRDLATPPKLLTQTDVVDYVLQHRRESGLLDALLEQPLRNLTGGAFLAAKDLATAHESSDLILELYRMVDEGLHALAVVDEDGKLVGTLSVTDLKGLVAEKLPTLEGYSVGKFLRFVQGPDPALVQVRFTKEAKLGDVCTFMRKARVHRAWIVDEDNKPVDVLSYTDVCKAVSKSELGH